MDEPTAINAYEMGPAIDRTELVAQLRALALRDPADTPAIHAEADRLLLRYIGDPEIAKLFLDLPRWYE